MPTRTLTALLALAALIPAASASARVQMTVGQARSAARTEGLLTLGVLLDRTLNPRNVRAYGCRTHWRRGICRVRVSGRKGTCTFRAHIVEVGAGGGGFQVSGDRIRCP